MDNIDDLLATLTPEQRNEMGMLIAILGKEMDVKDLKDIIEARLEALEVLKQIKKRAKNSE